MRNRLIAIGDIHGEVEKLNSLIDRLDLQKQDKVIFLGDYIDRGLNSKAVIERILDLSKKIECVFLKGNHEDMLLKTKITQSQDDIEHWLLSGGISTYDNYGDYPAIFNTHGKFLDSLKLYHIEQNYMFVHAGINPKKELSEQTKDDLLWIREEFLDNSHNLPYKIIFDHTPFREPLILDDKIGIDTGCGKEKDLPLTAFICDSETFIRS